MLSTIVIVLRPYLVKARSRGDYYCNSRCVGFQGVEVKSMKFGVGIVFTALLLVGCDSSQSVRGPDTEANSVEQVTEEATDRVSDEPCFTVGEIGSQLSLDWELVVASRDQSDQSDYIEDLMEAGDDLYKDAEPEAYPVCNGYQQIADFNYEVANLNVDILLGEDVDGQYKAIADKGNELLEISDDQGSEWDYNFVTDASEIES